MNGVLNPAQGLTLRKLLEQRCGRVLEANRNAWNTWRDRARATLPSFDLPRVFVAVHVQCCKDLTLHTGLAQLLAAPALQVVVVVVLPGAAALALASRQALREGWLGLITAMTEAEWELAFLQLPANAVLVDLPLPEPLDDRAVAAITASCAVGSNSACSEVVLLPFGGFVGRAGAFRQAYHGRFAGEGLDLVDRIVAAQPDLERVAMPQSDAAQLTRTLSTGASEIWLRDQLVEIPSTSSDDLISVSLLNDGEGRVIAAVQPVVLSGRCTTITAPLPPSLCGEEERIMEIHAADTSGKVRSARLLCSLPATSVAPWMLSAFLNRGGAGNRVISAFARGTGCRLAYAEDEIEAGEELGDIPVVWGVLRESDRILARARQQRIHYYYIDHAYFDRGHGNSYRITRNGYEANRVRKAPMDRLEKLGIAQEPWRKAGRSIVVCPPTAFFAAAHDCEDWLEETLAQMSIETDRPIVIREKPRQGEPFVPLAEALRDAHALVTHSSNVAIEAVCLGTPVFVSPSSAAAPVGQTDLGLIETPRYPKRSGWLAHLAYSQFTLDEFASGEAWKIMSKYEAREYV